MDTRQAELFGAIGRTPGVFRGISCWPTLDEVFKTYSRQFLEQHGQEDWEAAGGERGDDGVPTCRSVSLIAVEAVQQVVNNPGGLLWEDQDGVIWAVRLVPSQGKGNGMIGFSINWAGGPLPLDPAARGRLESGVARNWTQMSVISGSIREPSRCSGQFSRRCFGGDARRCCCRTSCSAKSSGAETAIRGQVIGEAKSGRS